MSLGSGKTNYTLCKYLTFLCFDAFVLLFQDYLTTVLFGFIMGLQQMFSFVFFCFCFFSLNCSPASNWKEV